MRSLCFATLALVLASAPFAAHADGAPHRRPVVVVRPATGVAVVHPAPRPVVVVRPAARPVVVVRPPARAVVVARPASARPR